MWVFRCYVADIDMSDLYLIYYWYKYDIEWLRDGVYVEMCVERCGGLSRRVFRDEYFIYVDA